MGLFSHVQNEYIHYVLEATVRYADQKQSFNVV